MADLPLMDLIEASARRDAGMAQVLENEADAWKEAYRDAADTYLRTRARGDLFKGEDVRAFAVEGIGEPHHPGCWAASFGSVVRRWKQDGAVEEHGAERARSVKSHGALMRVYRVT